MSALAPNLHLVPAEEPAETVDFLLIQLRATRKLVSQVEAKLWARGIDPEAIDWPSQRD